MYIWLERKTEYFQTGLKCSILAYIIRHIIVYERTHKQEAARHIFTFLKRILQVILSYRLDTVNSDQVCKIYIHLPNVKSDQVCKNIDVIIEMHHSW